MYPEAKKKHYIFAVAVKQFMQMSTQIIDNFDEIALIPRKPGG